MGNSHHKNNNNTTNNNHTNNHNNPTATTMTGIGTSIRDRPGSSAAFPIIIEDTNGSGKFV